MTPRERMTPALIALIAAARAQMERDEGLDILSEIPVVTISRMPEYDDRPIREPRPKSNHPRSWRKP